MINELSFITFYTFIMLTIGFVLGKFWDVIFDRTKLEGGKLNGLFRNRRRKSK